MCQNGAMTLLNDEQLQGFLTKHAGWDREEESIVQTFEFADFVEAMGFVTSVALAAEKADHHPDIDIRWNKVSLRLSTHSEGGLTHKDTELAERIDGLV